MLDLKTGAGSVMVKPPWLCWNFKVVVQTAGADNPRLLKSVAATIQACVDGSASTEGTEEYRRGLCDAREIVLAVAAAPEDELDTLDAMIGLGGCDL